MRRHINSVHNGQKDHKCDSCGKLFSQAGNLKKHIISVHNGQKDLKYDCKVEPMDLDNTISNSNQKTPNKIHNDKLKLMCNKCNKSFLRMDLLQKHIGKCEYYEHISNSKHKCNRCGKSFLRPNVLFAHVEKDHEGFECYICKKNFSLKNNLTRHIETLHKDIGKKHMP